MRNLDPAPRFAGSCVHSANSIVEVCVAADEIAIEPLGLLWSPISGGQLGQVRARELCVHRKTEVVAEAEVTAGLMVIPAVQLDVSPEER